MLVWSRMLPRSIHLQSNIITCIENNCRKITCIICDATWIIGRKFLRANQKRGFRGGSNCIVGSITLQEANNNTMNTHSPAIIRIGIPTYRF